MAAYQKEQRIEMGRIIAGTYECLMEVEIPGNELMIHTWSHDGNKLYVTSRIGLSNYLYEVIASNGEVNQVTEKNHVVHCYDQRMMIVCHPLKHLVLFTYSSPTQPAKIWAYEKKETDQLFHFVPE